MPSFMKLWDEGGKLIERIMQLLRANRTLVIDRNELLVALAATEVERDDYKEKFKAAMRIVNERSGDGQGGGTGQGSKVSPTPRSAERETPKGGTGRTARSATAPAGQSQSRSARTAAGKTGS